MQCFSREAFCWRQHPAEKFRQRLVGRLIEHHDLLISLGGTYSVRYQALSASITEKETASKDDAMSYKRRLRWQLSGKKYRCN